MYFRNSSKIEFLRYKKTGEIKELRFNHGYNFQLISRIIEFTLISMASSHINLDFHWHLFKPNGTRLNGNMVHLTELFA